jgi:hypothetical protein
MRAERREFVTLGLADLFHDNDPAKVPALEG